MVKPGSLPSPRLEPPVVSLVEINVSAPVRKTTLATYDGKEGERYENNAAKREDVLGGKRKGEREVSEIWVRIFTGSSDFTVAAATQQEIRTFSAAAPAFHAPLPGWFLMSIMAVQQGVCNQPDLFLLRCFACS